MGRSQIMCQNDFFFLPHFQKDIICNHILPNISGGLVIGGGRVYVLGIIVLIVGSDDTGVSIPWVDFGPSSNGALQPLG